MTVVGKKAFLSLIVCDHKIYFVTSLTSDPELKGMKPHDNFFCNIPYMKNIYFHYLMS